MDMFLAWPTPSWNLYAEKEGILALAGVCTETMQSHIWSGYNPEILLEILHNRKIHRLKYV